MMTSFQLPSAMPLPEAREKLFWSHSSKRPEG
jgi:hypothetical protein